MKKQRPYLRAMAIGMLLGMMFLSHGGKAVAAGVESVLAYPVKIGILIDDRQTEVDAYSIEGSAYVRLADIGREVDFNVYWDNETRNICVNSDCPYTGEAPAVWSRQRVIEPERQEIVDRTNAAREKVGLAPLEMNDLLMEAAQVRAEEMAAATLYDHVRPDGRKFNTVTDCPYVGENIHRISQPYLKYYKRELAETAVDEWLESCLHRENLLRADTTCIGVGVAKGKNSNGETAWYCVQLFMVDGGEISWVDAPVLT